MECPGYRDLHSLLFLDESEDVGRKVEKQQTIRHRTQGQRCTLPSKSQGFRMKNSVISIPRARLSVAMHEQALSFVHHSYLRNWLWVDGADALREDDMALSSAMTALGLSAMANMRMSPPLMLSAREEYIKALSATNRNVMDPILSKTDHTLMAVMFLGLFEVSCVLKLECL